MQREPGEEPWRLWWRRGFAAFLAAALLFGLFLSFRPSGFEDSPDLATDAGESEGAPASEEPAAPPSEPEPQVVAPEDEGLTPAQAQQLIDAARPPEETTVQVLDAGGGSDATNAAADALREFGYDVVAINSSRTDYPVTTVLFTDGNEAEAQALPARDERFADVGVNDRLSDDVNIHVLVGDDWNG